MGAFIVFYQLFSRPRRLLGGRLHYLGLNHFFTALSANMSINYTARAVCPALREPSRAEWRAAYLF